MKPEEIQVSLYNGDVEIGYNDHQHTYRLKGEKSYLLSATAVTNSISKIHLREWYANMAGAYIREHMEPGKAYTPLGVVSLATEAQGAARSYMRGRGDLGTTVHRWIQHYILYELKKEKSLPLDPKDERAAKAIAGFLRWVRRETPKWLWAERVCYSRANKHVGTCDAGAYIPKTSKDTTLDWKSGKRIYPESCLQVTSYAKACGEEDGKNYDRGILHVNSDTGAFSYYPESRLEKLSGRDLSGKVK